MNKIRIGHFKSVILSLLSLVQLFSSLYAQDPCNPDTIPPSIKCKIRYNIDILQASGSYLKALDLLENYVDNCTQFINLSFSFDTIILKDSILIEDTTSWPRNLSVYVTDLSGNKSSCQTVLTHSPCGTTVLRCKKSIKVSFPNNGSTTITADSIILPRACPLASYQFQNGLPTLTLDGSSQFPLTFIIKNNVDESKCTGTIYDCGENYVDPILECKAPEFPVDQKGGEVVLTALQFIGNSEAFCKIDSAKILILDPNPSCPSNTKNEFQTNAVFCCEDIEKKFTYYLKVWTPAGIQICTSSYEVKDFCNGILIIRVIGDYNKDCNKDSFEPSAGDVWFKAIGNGNTYYSLTNTFGSVHFKLPYGNYEIRPVDSTREVESFGTNCSVLNYEVSPNPKTLLYEYLFVKQVYEIPNCPLGISRINFNSSVECQKLNFSINYYNIGTEILNNSYLIVRFDYNLDNLILNKPYTSINDQEIRIELGDLPADFYGTIEGTCTIDCSKGRVYCIESNIFPKVNCLYENLNQPFILAEAECKNDSIEFRLTNKSNVSMQKTSSFAIIEDDIIIFMKSYKLNSGETLIQTVPMQKNYYILSGELIEGSEIYNKPSIWRYNCNKLATQNLELKNANEYNLDGNDFGYSIECEEPGIAFDPNVKIAKPIGVNIEHNISNDDRIDYTIHFQNVGEGPALNVRIEDYIDPNFDLFSIQGIFCKHAAFRVALDSQNRLLQIFFDHIFLPDSASSQEDSRGYVTFNIKLKNNLPLPTKVNNSASIYFDQNPAVITDTVFHTIDTAYLKVILTSIEKTHDSIQINSFPNPAGDKVRIELLNINLPVKLSLFDLNGKLMMTKENSFERNEIELNLATLPKGIYFFRMNDSLYNKLVASGKLIKK